MTPPTIAPVLLLFPEVAVSGELLGLLSTAVMIVSYGL